MAPQTNMLANTVPKRHVKNKDMAQDLGLELKEQGCMIRTSATFKMHVFTEVLLQVSGQR